MTTNYGRHEQSTFEAMYLFPNGEQCWEQEILWYIVKIFIR